MAARTEHELVEQVAVDYFEAWFDGDEARMQRVLHPDLVKRRAAERLGTTTRERMLELTRAGAGTEDGADRSLEVVVHDVGGSVAGVTVRSAVYHELIHLVRTDDGWRIANTLWEPA
jgi:ketosteroid isomerase-like protein